MNQKSDLMVQLTDGTIEIFSADALSADHWYFLDNHFVEECGRMFYKRERFGADYVPNYNGHFELHHYAYTEKVGVVDAIV